MLPEQLGYLEYFQVYLRSTHGSSIFWARFGHRLPEYWQFALTLKKLEFDILLINKTKLDLTVHDSDLCLLTWLRSS